MITDKNYCMNSFLMFRSIWDQEHRFRDDLIPRFFEENDDRTLIRDSFELEAILRKEVERTCRETKAAIALSGGIDSAILARFMPEGSIAYTFRCVVPGIQVTDETPMAAEFAKRCGLEHRIVEISWEDMERYAPELMLDKGAPIHSIEVQIYKAALQAKRDGFDTLIFGESADINYGGMDGLLAKDWTVPEFIERYSYVLPYRALRQPQIITEPFIRYSKDGYIDAHEFVRHIFYVEAMGTYTHSTGYAGVKLSAPFSKTYMGIPMDYQRIRNGESKYLVKEIFSRLYPDMQIPEKIPMPRPVNEWMKDWKGPTRDEFWPHCSDKMSGDQKWMVYALEKFLDISGC